MKNLKVLSQFHCVLIAMVYFFSGGVWAVFSDNIFTLLFYQTSQQINSVIYSHWFFVIVSSVLLYGFLRYWNSTQYESRETLQIMNRSLNSFSECVRAITKAQDEISLMQDICRICVEVGGHRMAWIAFAEQDSEKALKPVTHWGEKSCILECLHETWANTERGQGPAGTCIRTGEPVVFQNLQENRRYKPWQEAAQKCNFASCIALPLKNDQQTIGALVIFNSQANTFDKAEIKLLKELATDLSYGIKNLRLMVERRFEIDERLMLAAVTDQTSDGVITFDTAGVIQYMNPSFIQLCGIPAHQGAGASIHDFECSQRNHNFYHAVLEVFKTNTEIKGQFINKKSDGKEYEIDARISPVRNQSDQVVRYVATVRDISQEAKLERQLRQAMKMEAVVTLTGGIAHDFKNILAIIMAHSELALEQNPQDDQQQSMLSIYKAALRGKGLIQKFMSISRQNDRPKELINMEEIVSNSMKLLRSTFPSTIQIKTNVVGEIGQIKADAAQIQQVIMNICTNAKDTMQEGDNILEVSLSNIEVPVERQSLNPELSPGKYVMLRITDTGPGLVREELERIFEPFYQAKGDGKGSGLGLSVAHGIVTHHGGHILVNSILGVGTTFVVFLPQVEVSDAAGELMKKKQTQGRILIVGAEQEYISEMSNALQQIGYYLQAEIEGREALALFSQTKDKYDLIIADQGLPDMSGETFIREAHTIDPAIPVILCSEPESAIELENESFYKNDNILLKPYATEEMCQKVKNILKSA